MNETAVILPQNLANCQSQDWQIALANVITDPHELLRELNLDRQLLVDVNLSEKAFYLRVPRGFVARMKKGDPHDPLLRQVLPVGEELLSVPGFSVDPLEEKSANPISGLLHKYHGRVLLTLTGACAVHCRYCFRRHFPYQENNRGKDGWGEVLDYISKDPSITEVIYSGGDPLLVKDRSLCELTGKIAAIPHVKRLRVHSRTPIVLPERVTDDLLGWMSETRLDTVMVVHCNHANEIDDHVANAMQRLRMAGITVLNQSVLLKGVNDSVVALCELSERLFEAGIIPYYLNLLDKVQGAAHFEVDEEVARGLFEEVSHKLPGYLVPKFVREKAGALAKVPVL